MSVQATREGRGGKEREGKGRGMNTLWNNWVAESNYIYTMLQHFVSNLGS